MRFIIDDDHIFQRHEVPHYALDHLALCFYGLKFFAMSFKDGTGALGGIESLAQLKGVVIRNHDLGLEEVACHLLRDQAQPPIIVIGLTRQQHPEPVADRDTRRDDQESL